MRANLSSVKASARGVRGARWGVCWGVWWQNIEPTRTQVLRNRRWELVPPLKQPRHAFAVAANDGSLITRTHTLTRAVTRPSDTEALYAVGGWGHGSRCMATVEKLARGAEQWTPCAPLKASGCTQPPTTPPVPPCTPRTHLRSVASSSAWRRVLPRPPLRLRRSHTPPAPRPRLTTILAGACGNGSDGAKFKTDSVECYDPEGEAMLFNAHPDRRTRPY